MLASQQRSTDYDATAALISWVRAASRGGTTKETAVSRREAIAKFSVLLTDGHPSGNRDALDLLGGAMTDACRQPGQLYAAGSSLFGARVTTTVTRSLPASDRSSSHSSTCNVTNNDVQHAGIFNHAAGLVSIFTSTLQAAMEWQAAQGARRSGRHLPPAAASMFARLPGERAVPAGVMCVTDVLQHSTRFFTPADATFCPCAASAVDLWTQLCYTTAPREFVFKVMRSTLVGGNVMGGNNAPVLLDFDLFVPLRLSLLLEGGAVIKYHLISVGVHTEYPFKHWVAARGNGDGVSLATEWFRANDAAVDRVDIARYLDSVAGAVSVLWYVKTVDDESDNDDVDVLATS